MNELEQSGIKLVLVSIGTPANGKKLADHLLIQNPGDFLFVDPENALYDSLNLNKGLKSTFFSPGTPFAFLRRFTTRGAMTELNEVLPKWSKAIYVPPKQEQAFNQGGAFLFDGDETVFAHYDESTGDHCDIQKVIDLATERVKVDQYVLK